MGRRVAFAVLGILTLALPLTFLLPPGPPDPATPSAETINDVYWLIMAASAVVFLLIEGTLLFFVFRFRRRPDTPEDVEGPQIHGNTRLEVIWTALPAVALAAIAVFVLLKSPTVQAGSSGPGMRVSVEAHQFYWQYEYENGVVALDPLPLPVSEPVTLELQTLDVEHSWWARDLNGKLDVVPGRTNRLRFTPTKTGSFDGVCGELCGVQHALMYSEVEVVEREEFDAWLAEERQQQTGESTELGKATYEAVCGKCHGLAGEGDVGPRIAGNSQLSNPESMGTLLRVGQNTDTFAGYMPPNLSTG